MVNWIEFIPAVHDDSLMLQASYNPGLIVASVGIAVFSAYVALMIARPVDGVSGLDQWLWASVSAMTLGLGIWAMHFIGMLALSLPCGVAYNPGMTFVSMLPGMLCSGVALHLVRDKHCTLARLWMGGLVLGLGIGCMHYMGMAAMRFDGFVRYDITLFLLSIGVAVVFCFLALLARSRMVISQRYRTAVVAAIMGGAASSVHYTAMAAAYFVSGDGAAVHDGVISPGLLAVAIGTTTVLLTLLLLALSSASRSRAIALQLKENEKRLRKLTVAVEQSPSSIVMTDLKVNIVYANAAFLRQTGYTMEEVLGKNPRFLQSGKTPRQTYDALWQHLKRGEVWKGQLINRRKDGTDYTESALISPVLDDNGQGCVSSYLAIKEDITEQQQTEARLQQLAHFDQLTGLPNRTLLQDHFQFALSLAERGNEPMAVMFMDLDDFKTINDTLGHPVGDLLLMEIARRLKASVRDIDTVAHVGGDEFVFILPGTDAPGAAYLAQKLLSVVAAPCHISPHELSVTTSIGIVVYPQDGTDMETLSKNADAAMYRVKQDSHNNFRFFAQSMHASLARNLLLGSALRHALTRNQMSLHYQPQIGLQDGSIVGAEALLRWHHPELGVVPPSEFIPVAEANGMIITMGEWVLRTAVTQMKVWLDQGLPSMTIAVNLSAVQFRDAGLVEMVATALRETGFPASRLELELTEAVAMDDPQSAVEVMAQLHGRGIRMAIDDFGTGYSSLSYLKRFKVYKLKIDQSFVHDLHKDADDRAIVTAIINMASSLGMKTIAEGVETAAQLAFLREQGCDEVQGYYFSKPLPADQFEALVRA